MSAKNNYNAPLKHPVKMGYLMDETLGLITEYMQQFQPVNSQIWDFDEEEGIIEEVLEGATI
jgi:hypothetical protein